MTIRRNNQSLLNTDDLQAQWSRLMQSYSFENGTIRRR
jgi:hypothetical protein